MIPYILQMHSNEQVVNNNKQLLVINNKDPRIFCAKEIDFYLFDQHFGVWIEQFCLLLKKTHINAPYSFRTSYRGLPYISIWNVMRWKILKNKQIAFKILTIPKSNVRISFNPLPTSLWFTIKPLLPSFTIICTLLGLVANELNKPIARYGHPCYLNLMILLSVRWVQSFKYHYNMLVCLYWGLILINQ